MVFHARDDDVITSAGYRIGPVEIEQALASHPDVVMAAVVGRPTRSAPRSSWPMWSCATGASGTGLPEALQALVRDKVSAHCVPRRDPRRKPADHGHGQDPAPGPARAT
jgi:acetyl-CoA synthetase